MDLSFTPPKGSLSLIASFVLGLGLAYAVTGLVANEPAAVKGLPGPGQGVPAAAVDEVWRQTLLDRNVLGLAIPDREPEAQEEPAPPPEDGPDPAAWRVVGTGVGPRPVALVHTGEETEYLLEGEVRHGWELFAVWPEMVVWKKDERLKEVALWRDEKPDPTAAREASLPQANVVTGVQRVTLKRQAAAPLIKDPGSLLKQALFKPYTQGGSIAGFQIRNIKADSILRNLGIRNNDVLLRINGRDIDGPGTLMEVYTGLASAQSVSLDVLRKGAVQSILVILE